MRVFYLHGFASSAQSTKAGYFRECLKKHGVDLLTPDFNEPDFQTMTLSRMLEQLAEEVGRLDQTVTLIGSSLGGTVGVLAAARLGTKVKRLVLLAPAVIVDADHHLLPPESIAEWRRRGAMPFFHYAYGEERALNYTFYEDSLRYDVFKTVFPQPTLIFQGKHDAVVDPRDVEAFAGSRPNVSLSLLDDDHQMITSLPRIWEGLERFLGLAA